MALCMSSMGGDQPLKWFYPEQTTGNEFVYPKDQEKELAQDRQEIIVAGAQEISNSYIAGNGN